jgi:hypothetical protein
MILQIQSHEERFTDFLAMLMTAVIVITFIYICIMVLVAIYSAAMKVMGKPYILLDNNPFKWRIIRDAPSQDEEYVYGKYIHRFLNGSERVYLARKNKHGNVEYYDRDDVQWKQIALSKYGNFKPDREAGC